MAVNSTERKPWRQWQRELRAPLRVGSRVPFHAANVGHLQKCTEEETNNGTPIISHISDKKTLKKSKIVFLEAFFFGSLYKALLQKKLNRDICLQESFPASVLVLLRQFAAMQVFLNAVHHFPSLTISLL